MVPHDDPQRLATGERNHRRSDLQAVAQGAFMEEVLGLPRVFSELDRIDRLIDEAALLPEEDRSDEAIAMERARQIDLLVADLHVAWPWFPDQLRIGLWWRSQLVESARRQATYLGEPPPTAAVPGWPPKWTGDRRTLAVGGGPWAVVDWELTPRLAMRRGDSLDALRERWREISARVDSIFRSSMFSSVLDSGPPGGAPRDDAVAYERYARWAARKIVGGESYRDIAGSDLSPTIHPTTPGSTGPADARERWREVKRGVVKALAILDSI